MDLDISPIASKPNFKDDKIIKKILRHEGTGKAIVTFDRYKNSLTDYCYWYLLSTLWVSYSGFSDLRLWKKLFLSNRPLQEQSIMKPSELRAFNHLPEHGIVAYRAKRINETDCIAYTLDWTVAKKMALSRNVKLIHAYHLSKRDITALFLRRGEHEVIVLDKDKPHLIEIMEFQQEPSI
ncbi:hypothetical protein [Photobacterium leiognathi]|uniref:hypothetical protein n=1 Tax=Photobacterium leiognathi TaxID=553611 RepID=UPI002981E7E2|nr:hypothetical protein [Photobacterium leiognathi]